MEKNKIDIKRQNKQNKTKQISLRKVNIFNREKKNKKINYNLFTKKKIFEISSLIIISFLFCLSIINLPFLSFFSAFSFSFLFGYYAFPIYIFLILFFSIKVFNVELLVQRKLNKFIQIEYLLIFIIMFIVGTILIIENIKFWSEFKTQYYDKNLWIATYNEWWKNFTDTETPWIPNQYTIGVIPVFIAISFSSWTGFLVPILLGIFFIAFSIYLLFKGSPLKKHFEKRKKQTKEKNNFQNHLKTVVDLNFEDNNAIYNKNDINKSIKKNNFTKSDNNEETNKFINDKKTEIFDFEDPFSNDKIQNKSLQTEEIKIDILKDDPFGATFLFDDTPKEVDLETNKNKTKKDNKIKDRTFVFDNIDL